MDSKTIMILGLMAIFSCGKDCSARQTTVKDLMAMYMGAAFGNSTACTEFQLGAKCFVANFMTCLPCLDDDHSAGCRNCLSTCPDLRKGYVCKHDFCTECNLQCIECQDKCLKCLPGVINPYDPSLEEMNCRRCRECAPCARCVPCINSQE